MPMANAEDLKVKGLFDFNYAYNLNNPSPDPAGNNRYRVFDIYHDTMNVSLVNLTVSKTEGQAGVVLDFVAGHTADILSPNDETSKHIAQAFVHFTPKDHQSLKISAGKMFTHLGFETVKAKENWNYSRAMLFGYAIPFWHTGLAINYSWIPEKLSSGFYLYNETNGLYELNRNKDLGAQLKWNQGLVELTYNVLTGTESTPSDGTRNRTLHELIATGFITPQWSYAFDFVLGELQRAKASGHNAEWYSWTAALKWKPGKFYVSPRIEDYIDRSGVSIEPSSGSKPALPQRIRSGALTASYDCGDGLETRLEYRIDRSSSGTFTGDGGQTFSSQQTVTWAVLYEL